MSQNKPEIEKRWIDRWEKGICPFHMTTVNPLFERHTDWLLKGKSNARIFFPFCGKAVDMKWLYDKGHVIVGVEGAELAIQQFFEENSIPFKVMDNVKGGLKLYKSEDGRIFLYAGNYYSLPESLEEPFGAVWDRGALEAVSIEERLKYVELMTSLITPGCRLLVEVAERDDNKGPPYYISHEDMQILFGDNFDINLIDSEDPHKNAPEMVKRFRLYSVERKG